MTEQTYKRITLTICCYFERMSEGSMTNMLCVSIFLVCILACTCVSHILSRFSSTVSPVNQNIIRKLSSFCVLLITPAIYVQVWVENIIYTLIHLHLHQGSPAIWRIAFGPMELLTALVFRHALFSVIIMFCGIGNVIGVLRLMIVLKVKFRFYLLSSPSPSPQSPVLTGPKS